VDGVYLYGATAFPTQTYQASNYWVDVVYTTGAPDTTPPTVTSVTPASGATGVNTSTTVTATFSEAMNASTITTGTFVLRNGASVVTSTVSYNSNTNVATLTPSAALAASTTYTATISGGASGVKDLAGNALASNFVWSFTTGAGPACPCSVWSATATPGGTANDSSAVELGMRFRSDTSGTITGVRFYKAATNTGIHTGSLWTNTGTLLASVTFTGETASGWQQMLFSAPVAITANTTYDDRRRFAVPRSLVTPTALKRALGRLGFVQADPIRAPARAQDLTLRHRVRNYRAGDLERRYTTLDVEEDFFVNYGFVTRSLSALMHPRSESCVPAESRNPWPAARRRQADRLLAFVRERGAVHPREVDDHFSHGTVRNYWGGSSNATTHLLDAMHYRGLLRVARRDAGVRIYSAHQHEPGPTDAAECRARLDALVDVVVGIYAPLHGASLSSFVRRLRYGVPQWHPELKGALQRAKQRLAHARVNGV